LPSAESDDGTNAEYGAVHPPNAAKLAAAGRASNNRARRFNLMRANEALRAARDAPGGADASAAAFMEDKLPHFIKGVVRNDLVGSVDKASAYIDLLDARTQEMTSDYLTAQKIRALKDDLAAVKTGKKYASHVDDDVDEHAGLDEDGKQKFVISHRPLQP